MGRMRDFFSEYEDDENTMNESEERTYPVRLQVDGYNVNHYYDGDVPVYEIYDADGNVLEVAHSTNEMHEITHAKEENTD
ncbi:MAG: hypothetical protein K5696_05110 [Lachnospiraceae bacterium]|nr:hypothetical protein [Lachnospiraceae bacterium]